jgi:hypothetical protein
MWWPGTVLIQRFKTFNNKRNKSVYDVAGAISDQELEAMVKLAEELKNNPSLAAKPPSGAIADRAEWSDPCGRRLESHAGTEGASTATS